MGLDTMVTMDTMDGISECGPETRRLEQEQGGELRRCREIKK